MAAPNTTDLLQLLTISDLDTLKKTADGLIRQAGYEHFVYAFINDSNWKETGFTALMDGFPSGWLNRYFHERYTAVDPIPAHCFGGRNFRPLVWTPSIYETPVQQQFAEDAGQHGLVGGVTFPIIDPSGRWGAFSFSIDSRTNDAMDFLGEQLAWSQLLAVYVHDAFQRLAHQSPQAEGVLPPAKAPTVQLSERELECLRWCAAGKTAWEIGRILSISEWTVVYHLKNIKQKFGLSNKQQLVARAISTGLILP